MSPNPTEVINNSNFGLKDVGETDKGKEASQEQEDTFEKNYGPHEDRRIVRNVVILSVSFSLLFTSFSGMSRLQSSINTEESYFQIFIFFGLKLFVSHRKHYGPCIS